MRITSSSLPLLFVLFAPTTFSFNHHHEQQIRNVHPLFPPSNDPSRMPAGVGLSPESVVSKEEVIEGNGCSIGEVRVEGGCQQILGAVNSSSESSTDETLVKRGSSSIVKQSQILSNAALAVAMQLFAEMLAVKNKYMSTTSSVLPPVGTPILHAGASIQFTLEPSTTATPTPSSTFTTSSTSSASVAPSPALQALLSSRMPSGIAVEIPSIFPTFPPSSSSSSTPTTAPVVPSIPPIVYVPSAFPVSVLSVPSIIFSNIPIPSPSAAAAKVALNLPSPPSSSCANQYTNTDSGAVYGPGLGDFPMNPRPSTFVKRSGSKLTLDGQPYRIIGPNIYWLGLAENDGEGPTYPSKSRVREAMAIVVAMGGNTIRAHTLGVSTGHPMSVWPSNGNTNEDALKVIDYAIFAARNYGLRLLIPLSDNYQYYHGGKFDFINWGGHSSDDPDSFYYSDSVIKIYKAYISVILNRVNSYTGVAYKDDPTIMSWETGNELGAYFLSGGAPPSSWTANIAAYIKSIAPKQLIADGTDGLINSGGDLATNAFNVDDVDLITDHFYPNERWLLSKDNGFLLSQSKNYYVGELDWTGQFGGDDLASFYSQLESMSGSGSMIWSVFGHDDSCCNYVNHNDGYSLQYPNGNSGSLQPMILLLVQHWARMQGLNPPSSLPAVACPQPELIK